MINSSHGEFRSARPDRAAREQDVWWKQSNHKRFNMTLASDFDRQALIADLGQRAKKELAATEADLAKTFFSHYFQRVPGRDLRDADPLELYGSALAHLRSAQRKQPAQFQIRAFNPTDEDDEWTSRYTIVEVVAQDMAFLVDSIRMALNRLGYTIHLTIHPVIGISRDSDHRIRAISGHSEGAQPESFLSFRIDREHRRQQLELIESRIRDALDAVAAANEDLDPMRDLALELASSLETANKGVGNELQNEIASLCNWIADNNFTFLGAIHYQGANESGSPIKPDETSALGILKARYGHDVNAQIGRAHV